MTKCFLTTKVILMCQQYKSRNFVVVTRCVLHKNSLSAMGVTKSFYLQQKPICDHKSNFVFQYESPRVHDFPLVSSYHKVSSKPLHWRHNDYDCVSNHQPNGCLFNRLFRSRSKKTPKLRVTGLCAGNSPVTGEFPAQRASNAENVSIWWRHHETLRMTVCVWSKPI